MLRKNLIRQLSTFVFAPNDTVIEGGAKGADRIAREVMEIRGIQVIEVAADWKKHGKAAGPIRNQKMLDDHHPDQVMAFVHGPLLESKGTLDMVSRAKSAGIETCVWSMNMSLPVYEFDKVTGKLVKDFYDWTVG